MFTRRFVLLWTRHKMPGPEIVSTRPFIFRYNHFYIRIGGF